MPAKAPRAAGRVRAGPCAAFSPIPAFRTPSIRRRDAGSMVRTVLRCLALAQVSSSRGRVLGALALAGLLAACAQPELPQPAALPLAPLVMPPPPQASFRQEGLASWYGGALDRHLTASGERFDMNGLTAAHRSLPLDTIVRVTNLRNGETVSVRINDRGPFMPGRVIDLSRAAAQQIGMRHDGVAPVRIEVFDADQRKSTTTAESAAAY